MKSKVQGPMSKVQRPKSNVTKICRNLKLGKNFSVVSCDLVDRILAPFENDPQIDTKQHEEVAGFLCACFIDHKSKEPS